MHECDSDKGEWVVSPKNLGISYVNGPKEKEGGAMLKARGRLVVISAAGKDDSPCSFFRFVHWSAMIEINYKMKLTQLSVIIR